MKLPKIIDNKRRNLLDALASVAVEHKELSIATGYWDIEGMHRILPSLQHLSKIRLLIGREPLLKRDNVGNIENPEPDYPDEDFFRDLQSIQPSPELTQTVVEMKKLIDEGRLEVRVYRHSFLHAKCYIFGGYDSPEAVGIIGSSNFTRNGMTSNAELNALETDHRVVLFQPKVADQEIGHLAWFDELWSDEKTEDWTGEFIELIRTSPHGDTLYSPYELYIRTLHELYKDELAAEKDEILHPHSYQLFEFQERNVKNICNKLRTHGVAMLADSVGLGKTMSCIGVIKQYKNQRIVVIVPASLQGHWEKEIAREGILNARVISLQHKEGIEGARKLDEHIPVGLFIIDESHNLRSANATRYELISDWIAASENDEAHVLLATATPINNSLDDLVNQIILGAHGEQDVFTLAVRTSENVIAIRSFLEAVQNIKKRINQQATKGATEEELAEIYKEARATLEPVIQSFVVRNTRESVGTLIHKDGSVLTFPESEVLTRKYEHAILETAPHSSLKAVHQYGIEHLLETMDTMLHPLRQVSDFKTHDVPTLTEDRSTTYRLYQLILTLSFVPYRWRMYMPEVYGKTRDELRAQRFTGDTAKDINRQLSLYGIIRTTFLKRLESSAHALDVSLTRYQRRLEYFTDILSEKDLVLSLSDIDDILDEYTEDSGEEISDEELNKRITAFAEEKKLPSASALNKKEMLEDIENEKSIISELLILVKELTQKDAKLADFKEHLLSMHTDDRKKKVLVFSFYADTIQYLKDQLSADDRFSDIVANAAFVSGSGKKNALVSADRFSPVARGAQKEAQEQGELTYLFTTDVLSEGQNLQDAGHLINYDLHWNPVRMIQRNGRINRIGSPHTLVTVENYFPAKDLNEFLGLVERLRRKIDLIKHIIGTDASVLGEEIDSRAYIGIYSEDTKETQKTLALLEEKANAFTEDRFKSDLLHFYKYADDTERRHMERIPYGSWTVHPSLTVPTDVVTLAHFTFKDGVSETVKPLFFSNTGDAKALDILVPAQALDLIRSEVKERIRGGIAYDTAKHTEVLARRGIQLASFIGTTTDKRLTETETKAHAEARNNDWNADEQDQLITLLHTRNVHIQRKVGRLVRSISTALKEGKSVEHHYRELKKLLQAPQDPPTITKSNLLFGFSRE